MALRGQRGADAMSNIETDLDPFALARQAEGDAELFALIEEYKRLAAFACERGIGDDECDRRAGLPREVLERIGAIRPTTLAGVLATRDLGGDIEDPDHWPDVAIDG